MIIKRGEEGPGADDHILSLSEDECYRLNSLTVLYILTIVKCWNVECWSTPLQWLCEVAGYWQEHRAVHYHAATWGDGHVDEWHNNGPQDLITVSLCIQNAINKMLLCSLSITYACPYHNPTATMGHSIHHVDISKLTHTMPHTLSATCSEQWKPGFIREENTSPTFQTPSNVSICPLKSVTTTNCSQVEMRMVSVQMSLPETISDCLH